MGIRINELEPTTRPDPPKLSVIEAEPVSPDVIGLLEQALEMARGGQLSSVAISYVFRDGSPGRGWSTAPSATLLLGSVTITQHMLAAYMSE